MKISYAALGCLLLLSMVCLTDARDAKIKDDDDDVILNRFRRVIGGKSASDGQWPWLVSLQAKIVTKKLFGFIPLSYKKLYCGGSVLNDRWILTAAHCFKDKSLPEAMQPKSWHIRLAAVKLNAGFFDRVKHFFGKIFGRSDWLQWDKHAARIIIHPSYNPSNRWENDIALVQLKETVPSGPQFAEIKRIELPVANDASFPAAGEDCVTNGWGCTRDGGGVSATAMSTQLAIQADSSCSWRYGINMETRLCVGTSGRGICQGDSGGPLVCRKNGKWIQTGVASFIHSRRPDLYPSVFTRVSKYISWIKRYI